MPILTETDETLTTETGQPLLIEGESASLVVAAGNDLVNAALAPGMGFNLGFD